MQETENWLHKYRKLERDKDLLHFASVQSTNFADSRLKFKRNFLHLLQKLYLMDHSGLPSAKREETLLLVEHMLKQNTSLHQWDILQNLGFLIVCTHSCLHVMND